MSDFIGYLLIGLVLFWIGRTMLLGFRQGSKPDKKYKTGRRAAAADKAVPELTFRKVSTPTVDEDKDDWEGAFWDVLQQHPIKASVRFDYTSGSGKATQRTVHLRSFETGSSQGLVIGHCQMRNATRTFRYDRMRNVIDAETGEVLDDLQAWLLKRYSDTPQGVAEVLLDQNMDSIKVLLYIAKADGQMRAAERDLIAKYCAEVTQDARFDQGVVNAALGMLDVPTVTGFRASFERALATNPARAVALAQAAKAIVATQKTVHTDEAKALAWLELALKRAAIARDGRTAPASGS